jgi:hypothetical protein
VIESGRFLPRFAGLVQGQTMGVAAVSPPEVVVLGAVRDLKAIS